MKQRTITVISAETPYDQVVYVASLTPKDDGNYQVGTTFEKEEAYDFGDEETARQYIPKIFNPWERNYVAHEIKVERRRSNSAQSELR